MKHTPLPARASVSRRVHQGAKRALDVLAAALLLVGLSPLIVVVALLVLLDVGRPILFRQRRPGRQLQAFEMIKFRTMRAGAGTDAERLTAVGRFLRTSSLDELPELWNVLKGDMSLVGPRPLLERYVPYFTERERRRFLVRPGITGLAQVQGRNRAPWAERLAYDVEYVDAWSLGLDLRILVRTLWIVMRREGAVADANEVLDDLDIDRRSHREVKPRA